MIDPEENNNQEPPAEDIVDYWHGEADVSMPDIPIPTAVEKKVDTHKDECDVSFKFAFVGAGQGGSRIAEAFHQLGYRKISAINTAQQDLNTIRLDNKLCIGDGGAGKDPNVAEGLYMSKREDVLDFMYDSFGEDVDRIFVCAGAGGGSGSGTVCPLVDTALEMQKSIKCKSDKVGVILALPKHSEGKRVNANAYNTLNRVWQMVEEDKVSPLIILDNEKINKLYPGLAVAPFWRTANRSVAGLFHLFNHTASRNSSYSAFDSNDYKQILDSGLILFGASPVADWKTPTGISRCVRDNLRNNMLSGGIDINSGNSAGVVIIGGQQTLDEVPQENLDRAFDQFSRMLQKGNVVHRGIYSGDKENLIVYTAVGGIAKPVNKLEELRQLGDLN
jgi:cell division GTPase FtsZ